MAQVPPTPIYILSEDGTSLTTGTLNGTGTSGTPIALTGVVAGDTLVSMDVRPQNQSLYALGVNAADNTVRLYHLSPQTGTAVPLGAAASLQESTLGMTIDLPETTWDIDFNPAVDRVRVVSQTGLNFRMNPNNGALVDGATGMLDVGTNPDGAANGQTDSISATAYTNSQPNNGNITTQYTLDSETNSLYIQNPPNNGDQTAGQVVTVAGAPLDFTSVTGFDIAPGVNAAAGNTAVTEGFGYAVLKTTTTSKLYQINLANAQATEVRDLTTRAFAFRPRFSAAIALDATGSNLLRFNPLTPGTTTTVALTGVANGETIVSIDQRPATGQLYGLGINSDADTGTLYLIDPQTGAATAVGTPGQIAYKDGLNAAVDFPAVSAGWDIDFNPTVDRVRIVVAGLNMRANPNDGLPVDGNLGGAANSVDFVNTDGPINGATTTVNATAYTNSFAGTTVTTQYTLDAVTDTLYIQNPPNAGTQTAGLGVTLGGAPLDISAPTGFDILNTVTVAAANDAATGNGYFTATVAGTTSVYRLALNTGVATNLGSTLAPLSSFAIFGISDAAIVGQPTVANLTLTTATLGGTVTDDGGSPVTDRGVVYSTTANSTSPALGDVNVTAVSAGSGTGTFTANATNLTTGTRYTFRAYATTAVGTSYSPAASFTPPVLVEPEFPDASISEEYTLDLDPPAGTTVTAKGLPPGLKLSKDGIITGRLSTAGVYQIAITAKGPGGLTTSYISTLSVQALPRTAVGTFLAYVQPNSGLNSNTGGRLDVTVTNKGSYTLKLTQLAKTISAKGFLTTSIGNTPAIVVTLSDGSQVNLDLNTDNTLDGTLIKAIDSATVTGWRKTYDKVLFPASQQAGYYTVSLEVGAANSNNPLVPQGAGFASVTIGEDGSTKLVGKAADGSALTSTGFLGPVGDILVHAPLYKKQGSISGLLSQTNDVSGNFAEHTIDGELTLTKPSTTGRTYPGAVSLVSLDVYGKYMARAAKGSIVLGLPSANEPSSLLFTGAGIETTATSPALVDNVTLQTSPLKLLLPAAGSTENPTRTTVVLKAANGSLTGSFVLQDGALKRTVKFEGLLVRSFDGSTTASGFFLLPQATVPANASLILSGRVDLVP